MTLRRERNVTVLQARSLRRNMTLPEGLLWQALRTRPEGLKFRRQHPIGRCIVDFYCPAARLVIEVDGFAHDTGDRPTRDLRRDEWIRSQGLAILRLAAVEVLKDVDAALAGIVHAALERLPLHHLAGRDGSPPHSGAVGRN